MVPNDSSPRDISKWAILQESPLDLPCPNCDQMIHVECKYRELAIIRPCPHCQTSIVLDSEVFEPDGKMVYRFEESRWRHDEMQQGPSGD